MLPKLLTVICFLLFTPNLYVDAKELQVVFESSKDIFQAQEKKNFILSKDGVTIGPIVRDYSPSYNGFYRWYMNEVWSFSSTNPITKIEFLKEGVTGSNTKDLSAIKLNVSQLGTLTLSSDKKTATWVYSNGTNTVSFKNTDESVWFTKIVVTLDVPDFIIDGTSETASNTSLIQEYDGLRELKVGLQRKFEADGGWYTLCLPFYRTLNQVKCMFGEEVEVYWFSGVKRNEDGTVQLIFTPYTGEYPIVNGKPCLVKPSKSTAELTLLTRVNIHYDGISLVEEHDGVRFVGIYDAMSFPDDGNNYAFLSGKDGLCLAVDDGSGGKIKPTRAYFMLPSGAYTVGNVVLSETNCVHTAPIEENIQSADDTYYTLTGARIVGRPSLSGVYIHGRQKIVLH